MSHYFPASSFPNLSGMPYTTVAFAEEAAKVQEGTVIVDTIQHIQRSEEEEARHRASRHTAASPRVSLPEPGKGNSNTMDFLAAAFGAAFEAAQNGLVEETNHFENFQQRTQTQSQCILQSTQLVAEKQKQAASLNQDIENHKSSMELPNAMDTFTTVVGVIFMICTVVSGCFDFGLSDLLLPEELAADTGNIGFDAVTPLVDELTPALESEAEEGAGNIEAAATNNQAVQEGATQASQNLGNTLAGASKPMTALERVKWIAQGFRSVVLSTPGRMLMQAGLSAAMMSPSLVKGLTNVNIAAKLNELAKVQEDTGDVLAELQTNTGFYQFFQQASQREGGSVRQQASSTFQIVTTFGGIINSYIQISNKLHDSV